MAENPQEGGGSGSRVCPLCSTGSSGSSSSSTLVLRQINDTEAIYVCNNPNCVYPVGQEVVVVKRTVREMMPDFQETSYPEENSSNAYGCDSTSQKDAPSETWFNHDDFLDPDIGDWLDSQTY